MSADANPKRMDEGVFGIYDRLDGVYWRHVALREMLLEFFALYRQPRPSWRVLEIGPGVGETLKALGAQFEAHGLDVSEAALRYAQRRVKKNLVQGRGEQLPYADGVFDLVASTDVVEHVEHPERVFAEVYRVLRPGGLWLTIVPAYQSLWSERDVRLGHYKRYRVSELRPLFQATGFEVVRATYINLFYLPIFAATVGVGRWLNHGHANLTFDFLEVPEWVNTVLTKILGLETAWLKRHDFPWGASTLCVGRRPLG